MLANADGGGRDRGSKTEAMGSNVVGFSFKFIYVISFFLV